MGLYLLQVSRAEINPVAVTHRSLSGCWNQGLASAVVSHLQVKIWWKADFLQPLVTGSSSGWGLQSQAAVAIPKKVLFLQLMELSAHAGLSSCSGWSLPAACDFSSALGYPGVPPGLGSPSTHTDVHFSLQQKCDSLLSPFLHLLSLTVKWWAYSDRRKKPLFF